MELNVICKDQCNKNNNESDNITIICNLCCGNNDTHTTIKMILEDYGDEITKINYPTCEILNNKLNIS